MNSVDWRYWRRALPRRVLCWIRGHHWLDVGAPPVTERVCDFCWKWEETP